MEFQVPDVDSARVVRALQELGVAVHAGAILEAWLLVRALGEFPRPTGEQLTESRRLIKEALDPTDGPIRGLVAHDAWPETIEGALVLAIDLRRAVGERRDGLEPDQLDAIHGATHLVSVELAHEFTGTTRIGVFTAPDGRVETRWGATTQSEEEWLAAQLVAFSASAQVSVRDVDIHSLFACHGAVIERH